MYLAISVLHLELRIELIDPADRRSAGGRIVAEGMPEEVAAVEASHTGRYLRGRVGGLDGKAAGRSRR